MKRIKKTKGINYVLYGIIGLILVFSIFLYLIQDKGTNEVKIGYKKHLAYLPVFVAEEKEYFTDEGLDTKFIAFDSTNQMLGAVVSNNIDAAIGGPNLQTIFTIESKSSGSMKLYSTTEFSDESLFSCVMVRKDSEINSLEDIVGLKVATLPGSFAPLWINELMKEHMLSPVQIVGVSPKIQLSALESKQVDVLFTVEPVCSFGINKGIGKIIYKNPMESLGNLFAGSVISSDFVDKNPKIAKKIVIATDKAIDFIRKNPDEAIKIMAKYTGYKEELISGMDIPIYKKSDEINLKEITDTANKLYLLGNLERQVPIRNMIY